MLVSNNISDYNLMQSFYDKTFDNFNCHLIGKIIEFYPNTQTADIQIQHIDEYKGELFTPIILTNVPVFINGTSTAYITMPNLVGSNCVLLIMDKNIDAFLATGEMYQPSTTRKHDITDCIALLTFKTQVDAIQDYDNEAINIGYENSHIRVKREIEINGSDNIKITSPVSVTINSPDVSTTGNLNVGTGVSGIVTAGNTTLIFANGILTGIS